MTKKQPQRSEASVFDQARDELFSHILRCGVLEAEPEHQQDWLNDTMQYLADRYIDLSDEDLEQELAGILPPEELAGLAIRIRVSVERITTLLLGDRND